MKNSQNGYLKTSNQKNADFAVKKIIVINWNQLKMNKTNVTLPILFPDLVTNPQQQKMSLSRCTAAPISKTGFCNGVWNSWTWTDMAFEQQDEYRHLVQHK